jgi:hypothetical protein
LGQLHYARHVISMDDRTLLHVQIAMADRLRRGESFFLSWPEPESHGGGRSSVWINSAVPLGFDFSSRVLGQVNKAWLEALSHLADSATGLIVCAEPLPARERVGAP